MASQPDTQLSHEEFSPDVSVPTRPPTSRRQHNPSEPEVLSGRLAPPCWGLMQRADVSPSSWPPPTLTSPTSVADANLALTYSMAFPSCQTGWALLRLSGSLLAPREAFPHGIRQDPSWQSVKSKIRVIWMEVMRFLMDVRSVNPTEWHRFTWMEAVVQLEYNQSQNNSFSEASLLPLLFSDAVSPYRNNSYEHLETKAWGKAAGALLWWE